MTSWPLPGGDHGEAEKDEPMLVLLLIAKLPKIYIVLTLGQAMTHTPAIIEDKVLPIPN
jgi:hypothetical protein